jgi:hypothetical protein
MREGFSIPDPTKPQQIQLAPALCAMVNGTSPSPRRISEVRVGTACPPKTVLQPICVADLNNPATLPDGGTSTDGGCNIGIPLTPAPSALYVLLDDAASMGPIFSANGLQQVVSFSLSDPAFRTTSIGFKLLPHDMNDCAPAMSTSYSSLDVPFALATTSQSAIAKIVGDSSKLLPTSPPLFLDAALQPNGAYKALRDFRGTNAFNRMAVMMIFNRAVTADCGGMTASQLAAAAFNTANIADRIHTYVVMLDIGGDAGTQDAAEALNIATAGGGARQFFDARIDKAQGAVAFNTVVTDLGSCLYEKPANIVASSSTVISYQSLTSATATSIAFNAACTEAAQNTADGWNLDPGGRVRVCGKSCSDLRGALTTAAAYAASRTPPIPVPDIPISAMQPCQ